MDDQKSLSIALLVISDQYATFNFVIFFYKMAADDQNKSLSIAFLAILDQFWKSSKVKGHPVKKSWGQLKDHIHVYDFLYVFQVNFGHDMHHSEDTAH